jgi:hypothetical protein
MSFRLERVSLYSMKKAAIFVHQANTLESSCIVNVVIQSLFPITPPSQA